LGVKGVVHVDVMGYILPSGKVDFAETMEMENGNRKRKQKHGKYC